MKYSYSSLDRKNMDWFKEDTTRATSRRIMLLKGSLRSLFPFDITFDYPISAISGKNCSGKLIYSISL